MTKKSREIDQEIEKVESLKSEFVSMVSHELRTPMTIIKEAANLLLTKKLKKNKQKEYLEMIQKHVDRLNVLISDLLDLSKIENNKLVLDREPIDFGKLAQETVARLAPIIEEKQLIFLPEIGSDLPIVVGDKKRINQVILNLIGNAIKYSLRGGKIGLQILKEKDTVIVKVVDTGRGLSPEQIKRVFDQFYVADEVLTRSSGGTGLGLPIAKGIVEAMGGSVWGESAGLDRGSIFTFSLPLEGKEGGFDEEQNIVGG